MYSETRRVRSSLTLDDSRQGGELCYAQRMSLRSLLHTMLSVFAALLMTLSITSARADDATEFNDVIKRAVTEFDSGNWEEASALFRRAHELNPSARTWRGLGLTSYELRRYVDAIAQLEAALADPRKPLTTAQRKEVDTVLKRAREFVSVYRVKVVPAEAEVLVDGRPASLSEGQLFLDPGPHTVVVRAPGYEERRADVRAAAGTKDELSLELTVAGQPEEPQQVAQPVDSTPAPVEQAPAEPRRRIWTWALSGATVVAGATALGLGLATNGKEDDLNKCNKSEDRSGCKSIANKGESLQLGTNLTLGLTGAFLVGAVTAYFLEGRDRSNNDKHVRLDVHPTGILVHGRF